MSASTSSLFKRLAGTALGVGVIAGAGWLLLAQTKAGDSTPAKVDATDRPVLVQSVRSVPSERPRLLVGTIRARIEADQAFRITGKIVSRSVQLGAQVEAGAELARLDPTDLALQRESAEAEHKAAESAERQARLELDRVIALRQQGWSTEQALDRQKAQLDEATGRRQRAERTVEIARNAQSYAVLKSDAAGIVTTVLAEVGQVIAAGQPMVRIARNGDREAQVAVPENEIVVARTGKAEASLWSEPGKRYPARLREISPNADPATRTFQARYQVDGLPPNAPLGMTVSLSLSEAESRPVVKLPLAALVNDGRGTEVFVVEKAGGVLRRRSVVVGAYGARDVTITSGLSDGEDVVVLGVHKLRDGLAVRIQRDAKQG